MNTCWGVACAQAANRLPRPGMHAAARALSPELSAGFAGLSDGAAATLDALLDLQDALLDRVPACRGAGAAAAGLARGAGGKRGQGAAAQAEEEDASLPGAGTILPSCSLQSSLQQRHGPGTDSLFRVVHALTELIAVQ
jgi:hypothetical protein